MALLKSVNGSLLIVLLAFDRPYLTGRLLCSLRDAFYPPSAHIELRVLVDVNEDGIANEALLCVLRNFDWKYGPYKILPRTYHHGLQLQWLTSWQPFAGDQYRYALVLEDDLEVSPFYYHIIQAAIAGHRSTCSIPPSSSCSLFAMALQRPQWVLGRNEHAKFRRLDLLPPSHPSLFTFAGPATWGLLLIAEQWKGFLEWASSFLTSSDRHPYPKGAITTIWVEQRGEDALISPLMLQFMRSRGLHNLYMHWGNHTTLLTTRSPLPTFRPYQRDRLVGVAEMGQVRKLIKRLRIGHFNHLPHYSSCFDPINVTQYREPFSWQQYILQDGLVSLYMANRPPAHEHPFIFADNPCRRSRLVRIVPSKHAIIKAWKSLCKLNLTVDLYASTETLRSNCTRPIRLASRIEDLLVQIDSLLSSNPSSEEEDRKPLTLQCPWVNGLYPDNPQPSKHIFESI